MSIEIKSDILAKELNQGIVPLGVPKAYQYDAALVEAARAAVNQGIDDVAEAGATAKAAIETQETASVNAVSAQEQDSKADVNALGDKILAQMKHGYGYPFTAATAAAMADTTKIYVYTGSETGYTNGNWYYWNGTAWVSGGVYNATALEMDKTLTVSGAAADAKVTGDNVRQITSHAESLSLANNTFVEDMSGAVLGKYIASTGAIITNADFQYKIFTYYGGRVFSENNDRGNANVVYYNENMVRLDGKGWSLPSELTSYLPSRTRYICISITTASAASTKITQTIPISEKANAVDEISLSPRNRNGSRGNPDNPNCITINQKGYIECKSRYIRLSIDANSVPLQDGYSYCWEYFISDDEISFTNVKRLFSKTPYFIIDTDGHKYVALMAYRVLDSSVDNTEPNNWTHAPIRVEDVGYYVFKAVYLYAWDDLKEAYVKNSPKIITPLLINGTIGNPSNQNSISTKYVYPFKDADSVTIYINIESNYNYKLAISTFSVDSGNAVTETSLNNRIDKDIFRDIKGQKFTLHKDEFRTNPLGFAFNINKYDSNGNVATIRSSDVDALACMVYNYTSWDDYILDNSLVKKPVNVRYWGYIPRLQAFIVNDGYVYSIDPSGISKSTLKDPFTVISENSISAGHGNNLQLALDGYAYASGWNDNKLYKIDLATLSIVDTISLPITGYSTAVIDTHKKNIYIFHQSTLSDGYYYFSVYDIDTNNIILSKKTLPFANIQAVDLFDDRIIVMAGLHEAQSPNKMIVFDTSGNVLCNYYLSSIPSEYEGVCIDRNNHNLWVSDVSQILYKIEF